MKKPDKGATYKEYSSIICYLSSEVVLYLSIQPWSSHINDNLNFLVRSHRFGSVHTTDTKEPANFAKFKQHINQKDFFMNSRDNKYW